MEDVENATKQEPLKKEKMSQEEEFEYGLQYRNSFVSAELFAEQRSSQLGDEFTKLEVQISTIILAFAGFFLEVFQRITAEVSPLLLDVMKFLYILTLFFLILSLVMGLIHIKRKQMFWEDMMEKRIRGIVAWKKFLNKDYTLRETNYFLEGLQSGNPILLKSPTWTWVVQTVSLGLAFTSFFILFLLLLIKVVV